MELSWAEKRDWLRLIRTPTVGPVAFASLLAKFGTAEKALEALPSLVRRKPIQIPPVEAIEQEMDASAELGVSITAMIETDYPYWLKALDPPPPLIMTRGKLSHLHQPCVAIVGSRNASAIGQSFARSLAAELGQAGFTVVSGLARGIDTAAHYGALQTGTAAVLGGGVDHIYPRQNEGIYHDMCEQGVLVSESPIGYRATAKDFPRRNRIISGFSRGVVVIEAAERSGTLITARYALEQNREVMAVPGSPLDPRSKGCNRLIRQGAALIESAEDVVRLVQDAKPSEVMEPIQSENIELFQDESEALATTQKILGVLSTTPTSKDMIIRALDLPVNLIVSGLLELELAGDIYVEPDGRICRVN